MTTSLSNLAFSNGVYSVPSSGGGLLTINTPTTSIFTLQYNPYVTANYNHYHDICVKDTTSNIKAVLVNSNLLVSNKTSNLFSVPVTTYLQSNAFNTVSMIRQDNFLQVNLNNTAIVRISNSNELPKAYDNSYIEVSTSNGSFSNVVYNPIATVDSPMSFTKPTKFLSISVSNISSPALDTLSNVISSTSNQSFLNTSTLNHMSNNFVSFSNSISSKSISTSNSLVSLSNVIVPQATFGSNVSVYSSNAVVGLSNLIIPRSSYASNNTTSLSNAFYTSTTSSTATYASNTATWSSNNLFQKSGGTITGGTVIQSDIYKNIPLYDPSYGDYSQFTISTNNNVVGQTYPSQLKLGVTNCNDGMTYIQSINPWVGMPNLVLQPINGNVGVGRSNPSHKLDVNGNTRLNNAVLGDCGFGTGFTAFCHSSTFNTGSYALLSQDIGETYLNCASGRNLRFRQNNTDMGIFDTNGRFGVNTTSPKDKLHVVGTAQFQGTTSPGSGIYSKCKWLNPAGGYGGLLVSHDATYGNQSIIDNSVNPLDVVVEGTTRLCVQKATGRTGINTSNPQYTLHVAGTFFASNVNSPTITNLSNASYPAFSASLWSSNNLLNKAGGTITGDLSVIRGVGNPTTLSLNSTGAGNTQSIIQFVNNGNTIVCADSNWNNQTRPTLGHCVFYTSGGHIFSGDTIFNGNLGGNAITSLSNMAIWSSNTARYSSNYGGTLCNLATDAFNKAVYGSNVANWSSNALLNPTFSNITGNGYMTLKAGVNSTGFTHLPWTGNNKNYLRGDTIIADLGGNVGIGTATPAYKLEVNGTAKVNTLQVGTNGDPMAEISHYSVTIPSSGVKTFQLDVSGTFPSAAVVYATVQSGNPVYDDCFGVTVMATSASNIKFSISRIDGGSWGQTPLLNFVVFGF